MLGCVDWTLVCVKHEMTSRLKFKKKKLYRSVKLLVAVSL